MEADCSRVFLLSSRWALNTRAKLAIRPRLLAMAEVVGSKILGTRCPGDFDARRPEQFFSRKLEFRKLELFENPSLSKTRAFRKPELVENSSF